MAIADARERAEDIAKELGLRLGRMERIDVNRYVDEEEMAGEAEASDDDPGVQKMSSFIQNTIRAKAAVEISYELVAP